MNNIFSFHNTIYMLQEQRHSCRGCLGSSVLWCQGVPGSIRNSLCSVLLAQYSGGLIRTLYRITETIRITKGNNNTVLYEDILQYWENTKLVLK